MAKVTLIEGDRTVEMEGKAVIAFVVNPAVKGGEMTKCRMQHQ